MITRQRVKDEIIKDGKGFGAPCRVKQKTSWMLGKKLNKYSSKQCPDSMPCTILREMKDNQGNTVQKLMAAQDVPFNELDLKKYKYEGHCMSKQDVAQVESVMAATDLKETCFVVVVFQDSGDVTLVGRKKIFNIVYKNEVEISGTLRLKIKPSKLFRRGKFGAKARFGRKVWSVDALRDSCKVMDERGKLQKVPSQGLLRSYVKFANDYKRIQWVQNDSNRSELDKLKSKIQALPYQGDLKVLVFQGTPEKWQLYGSRLATGTSKGESGAVPPKGITGTPETERRKATVAPNYKYQFDSQTITSRNPFAIVRRYISGKSTLPNNVGYLEVGWANIGKNLQEPAFFILRTETDYNLDNQMIRDVSAARTNQGNFIVATALGSIFKSNKDGAGGDRVLVPTKLHISKNGIIKMLSLKTLGSKQQHMVPIGWKVKWHMTKGKQGLISYNNGRSIDPQVLQQYRRVAFEGDDRKQYYVNNSGLLTDTKPTDATGSTPRKTFPNHPGYGYSFQTNPRPKKSTRARRNEPTVVELPYKFYSFRLKSPEYSTKVKLSGTRGPTVAKVDVAWAYLTWSVWQQPYFLKFRPEEYYYDIDGRSIIQDGSANPNNGDFVVASSLGTISEAFRLESGIRVLVPTQLFINQNNQIEMNSIKIPGFIRKYRIPIGWKVQPNVGTKKMIVEDNLSNNNINSDLLKQYQQVTFIDDSTGKKFTVGKDGVLNEITGL